MARIVGPKRAPKPTAFPLLPASAAAFLLLGGAQLAFWWWESRLPDTGYSTESTQGAQGNPFVALARQAAPDTGRVREAQRLGAVVQPQNIQFGDALARVTVTIFTDPSCGPCREKVREWTAGLPVQGVRQVYKFWPQDPARTTPGMLLELARRSGVVANYWRSIQGAGPADLDDATLLNMLERAGVPLNEQRNALVNDGADLMATLEPDLALAKGAGLPPPPVVMVDDYVLDGQILSPQSLGGYVQKRLDGRQIFERDDLFLMQK